MCDKKRFASRALAIQRLHEIKTRGEIREKNPVRVYYCRVCGGFHLTSSPVTGKQKYRVSISRSKILNRIADYFIKKNKW